MVLKLRENQKKNLEQMFNFNSPKKGTNGDLWKVLILDKAGMDIIAPLFTMNEIRDNGVTLHLLIDSKKEPISDVPAIYFIHPSYINIDHITKDLEDNLYKEFHINFISVAPDPLLQYFARKVAEIDAIDRVKSVFDQYCHFRCDETQLFNIQQPDSLKNSIKTKSAFSEIVVERLVCVFRTLNVVPVIKARNDGISKNIATKLSTVLEEIVQSNDSVFSNNVFSFMKPKTLLLLAERTEDIPVMLHHTNAYQALIHDLLSMHHNRVQIPITDEKDSKAKGEFHLDSEDEFWKETRRKSFSDVAESVSTLVKTYKALKTQFTARREEDNLMDAIDELPKIRKQKASADRHTAVASAVSKQIEKRNLAEAFLAEENIMARKSFDVAQLANLMRSEKMSDEDKTRLLIILMASSPLKTDYQTVQKAFLSQIEEDSYLLKALKMAAKLVNFDQTERKEENETIDLTETDGTKRDQEEIDNDIKALASRSQEIIGSLFSKGAKLFSEVKNLIPSNRCLGTSKLLQTALESKRSVESDLITFDPNNPSSGTQKKSLWGESDSFGEIIVFVLGGGNYTEFINLQEFVQKRFSEEKQIDLLYGCCELVSPENLLKNLASLDESDFRNDNKII